MVHRSSSSCWFRGSLAAVLGLTAISAQCNPVWLPGDPLPCVQGEIAAAVAWDPDGTGPLGLQLVTAGRFAVGVMQEAAIAIYDGTQWSAIGVPPGDSATALGLWSGTIVAAFDTPHPTYAQTIAAWDGVAWQPLGTTLGTVQAIASFNGELVVAGSLTNLGGLAVANVARWTGTTWLPLGSGVQGPVAALAVYSGRLYVGGSFLTAGGSAAAYLALWDGAAWSPVSGGSPDQRVQSLAVRSSNNALTSFLIVGGHFTAVGSVPAQSIARYNVATSTWTAFAGGLATYCSAVAVRNVGLNSYEVIAGCGGLTTQRLWRWSGSSWAQLPPTTDPYVLPVALTYHAGSPVVGLWGSRQAVQRFDGTSWAPVSGPGIDGRMHATLPIGTDAVIGGAFRTISGLSCNGIARGSPGAWSPLGSGMAGGANGASVSALATAANGDLVAGGDFATAGGVAASNVARWDGASWTPLGAGVDGPVHALLVRPNGDLIVGGAFTHAGGLAANHVARWDGANWSPLGAGTSAPVHCLCAMPNGDIALGGDFATAGSFNAPSVARWDGTSFHALGSGLDGTTLALAVEPDGDLVAGGMFLNAGAVAAPYVARWNGVAWAPVDLPSSTPLTAEVRALCVLPDGDLVAGGGGMILWNGGTGAVVVNAARLHGTAWSPVPVRGLAVDCIASTATGDLLFGGDFLTVNGQVAVNHARWHPTCPAASSSYGGPCTGSAGTLALTPTSLPWLGGTYRARATGLAASGLAFDLLGFNLTAVPLGALHPTGVPGCTLLVDPVVTQFLPAAGGQATVQHAFPRTVTFAGLVLRDQLLQFELGPTFAVTALTGTNGLHLTLGWF
ncbi:MAG: hypothetical protein FJ265_06525 [Planctomycetes bacterium]|nr:hypothetical protein [Planctomycetota bacterium]